jgi:glycerol-3-phosphate acyltransferase PlsY
MLSGRFLALCLVSYVAGALVTAYYAARLRSGVDLRVAGSGTLGARNASRVLGLRSAIAIACIDLAKGAASVLAARALALEPELGGVAALCAVCGHVWPPQLGWRGGKGAAIAGGALIALDTPSASAAIGVLLLASLALRDTKRGGLIGFAAFPWIALGARGCDARWGIETALIAVVLLAHRSDVRAFAGSTGGAA